MALTAMEKRRGAEVLCTIAVVLGLHLGIVWMLLTTSRVLSIQAGSQSLEFVFIGPPARPAVSVGRHPLGGAAGIPTSRSRNAAEAFARTTNPPPASNENNALIP